MFYDPAASRSIGTSLNLVWTLYWQSFTPRSSRENMKLVWIFAEPVGQMAVLMVIFTLIGRTAAYGDSFALFLLTGVTVLTLFSRGAAQVASGVMAIRSRTRLAQIGLFHRALAGIGFTMTTLAVTSLVLLGFVALWDRLSLGMVRPGPIVAALGLTGLLAFGIGVMRGHAARFFPAADRVFGILSRALLFVSGIFFVPAFLPPALRDILVWNPILHAVEMVRTGIYPDYPRLVLAPGYLVGWALGAAAFGVALAWFDRRRLLE